MDTDYESIVEEWHIYNPNTYEEYTIIRQQTAIGTNAASYRKYYRTYNRQGMRTWQDDVKNKQKKKIIEEVKEWFDTNGIPWKTYDSI